jgi:hypothetical protein
VEGEELDLSDTCQRERILANQILSRVLLSIEFSHGIRYAMIESKQSKPCRSEKQF